MMWVLIILVAVALVGYLVTQELKKSGDFEKYVPAPKTPGTTKGRLPSPIYETKPVQKSQKYKLVYDGAYDFESYPFEIVGEASYQSNIERFAVKRDGKGSFTEVEARIIRDLNNSYDKNATKVDINGLTVGYFARNNAESWVKLLGRLNMSDNSEVFVNAVIVGGGSEDYKFGVRLDMPSRVANSAKYIQLG